MAQEQIDVRKREAQPRAGTERDASRRVFRPKTDIIASPDKVILVADMPGVDEASTEVSIDDNVLTVRGRVNWSPPVSHEELYTEYEVGDYHRAFTLSEPVDVERIAATIRHGVLRLELPKAAPPESRKIQVRGG